MTLNRNFNQATRISFVRKENKNKKRSVLRGALRGLERHEVELLMTYFSFLGELSL